jgi:hypothetical protein
VDRQEVQVVMEACEDRSQLSPLFLEGRRSD